MTLLWLLLVVLARTQTVVDIYGSLSFLKQKGKQVVADKPTLDQLRHLHITLNGGEYKGTLDIDRLDFAIYSVKQGRHSLRIDSLALETGTLVVDVLQSGEVRAFLLDPASMQLSPVAYPLKIEGRYRQYYEVYEEWTIASLFKNQMSIFLMVTLVMMFLAKKMPNLEEMAEQEREQQKAQQQVGQQGRVAQ